MVTFWYLFLALSALALAVKAANIFIDQSLALASKCHLDGFMTGFFLITLGTSAPELASSLYSSAIGHEHLAVATIIGSNIANISLVLGLLALLKNYHINKTDAHKNIPQLLITSILLLFIVTTNNFLITTPVSIALIALYVASLFLAQKNNHHRFKKSDKKPSLILLFLSASGIFLASKFCVDNIIDLATQLNLSENILGYFVLALGTSLPEFITMFAGLKKGATELVLGNILGANLFNSLFILGSAGLITPINILDYRMELIFMITGTALLMIFALRGRRYFLSRPEGATLICLYLLFFLFQLFKAGAWPFLP